MIREGISSQSRKTKLLLRKAILSWHVVSLVLLLLTVSICGVMSSTLEEDIGKTVSNIAGTALPTSAPLLSNTTTNKTSESYSATAADCTLDVADVCPDNLDCSSLGGECITCDFNTSCVYGSMQKTKCWPKANVTCMGDQVFEREYNCRYCYQLPHWQTWCNQSIDCALNKPRTHWPARPFFVSTCWARSEHLCMGRRCFHKQVPCNWSKGYKWSKAMLLSIFLGGFGVDRFYLGFWVEGIGKLLSFGGLGVWTIVDVILIAVGYIGPSDGSIYI